MREAPDPSSARGPEVPKATPPYPPMPIKTVNVIKAGVLLWAVALVITLVVPALRTGERHWWPWACVAGLSLGLLGYLYVRRGRGNAEGVS